MPNWCNNSISITHEDLAVLETLANAVREGKFCDFAIPVPEDLKITAGRLGDGEEQRQLELKEQANIEKYGVANWYDFCTSRWGTKWDVESYEGEDLKIKDGVLSFGFDSAWSPPTGVYQALYEQGFSVKAFYYEGGMAFCGKWEDGDDDYYELGGMSSKQVADEIDPELDEIMGISEEIANYEEEEENENE